jgi:carbon starvation protein
VNSLWLVITALAAFAVAYRFYGAFLAAKVAVLNDQRTTPAHRLRDDIDYQPTRRLVLFGVHFAAIAGPGPLVGPVLAAQWGYFPGFIWIVIGACLAGGVHDFVVLLASVRQDGLSLPKIASRLLGPLAGLTTTLATLFIVVATLAGVAMVVVNALSESAWGMFTILVTIPAALITGLWMNKIRPGRVGEASVLGVTLVMLGVLFGKYFQDHQEIGQYLTFTKPQLCVMLPAYAAVASVLPVWLLLCPRDYLSSYMKIGVIIVLAVGIFVAHPVLLMPATTPFIHGNGPVVPGTIWPFVCIVIMCGALSGFHALVGSGTTPKMINRESDIRPIGYGAMLLEGFVSITALVAACALEPGDYFMINIPQKTPADYTRVVERTQTELGWDIAVDPEKFRQLEEETNEKLAGRVGGAVTLAVGMAKVFAAVPGMKQLTAYWYHFVIMFEALFILTLLETGTRVARFVFEETLTHSSAAEGGSGKRDWGLNALTWIATALFVYRFASLYPEFHGGLENLLGLTAGSLTPQSLWLDWPFALVVATLLYLFNFAPKRVRMSVVVCALWGYLLYTGNIASLWRMLGIANQLLAVIGLAVGTTFLLQHASKRAYALCTGLPFVFVVITVFTAGVQSIGNWWSELATLTGPENAAQAFNIQLMCGLASIMLVLSALIVASAVYRWMTLLRTGRQPVP